MNKYTDRFLKLPIRLVLRSNEDMGISDEGEDAIMNVIPMDISRYYAVRHPDDTNVFITKIVFKNGDPDGTLVYCSIENFEEKLNKHQS